MVSKTAYITGALCFAFLVPPAVAGSPTPELHVEELKRAPRPQYSRYRYNKRGVERANKGVEKRTLRDANHRNVDVKRVHRGSLGRNMLKRTTKRAQRRSRGDYRPVNRRSMDNGKRPLRYYTPVDEVPTVCSNTSRMRRTRCNYKRKSNDRFR